MVMYRVSVETTYETRVVSTRLKSEESAIKRADAAAIHASNTDYQAFGRVEWFNVPARTWFPLYDVWARMGAIVQTRREG